MVGEDSKRQVFEERLHRIVSKTHSISAFLQWYGLDIYLYGWIFMLGHRKVGFHFSTVCAPILGLVMSDILWHKREQARLEEVAQILRDEDSYLVLSNVNRLLPWLRHPDIEYCSWLNKLIYDTWPYVCANVEHRIKKNNFKRLKISKAHLGEVPPMITGVKVHDKEINTDQLTIDVYLYFSGDCEFSFSVASLSLGIRNFQVRGSARMVLFLMDTPPFIRGVQFCFLDQPEVDFTLTGVGSLGLIEETVKSFIKKEISLRLVFPRSYTLVLSESAQEGLQDPGGVIRINVVKAKGLENKDVSFPFSKNLSDPFAEVKYGSKVCWSEVIENSSNPQWDFWCEFAKDDNEEVHFRLMDKDVNSNDLIGSCSLSVAEIKNKGVIDSWFRLSGSKGSIYIRAFFLKLSSDVSKVAFPPPKLYFLSSFLLVVRVKCAYNLLLPRSFKNPSPKVQLTVGNDDQEKETEVVKNTANPVFDQTFQFFVNNIDFDRLKMRVVDEDGKTTIGSFTYSLRKLLDCDLEILNHQFPLQESASDSTLVVSMRLRIIKNVFI
ncbi:extended synaptotagmin-2-like [Macrosteles quadrilineatus]|uniref:extended synaptotagmin-2-like n=1 Tax=Macrosteles quadrilineatus TaxID=74068 RepID=UPI0023E11533|nr:extended synaptotagmin-2-like [Macrosteles quadrilineatus]